MDPNTVQLILALIPLAEKLVFEIGGKTTELNTTDITSTEDLIAAIEKSKTESWPQLKFLSPVKK